MCASSLKRLGSDSGVPRLSPLTYSVSAVFLGYGAVVFLFGPSLTAMAETFGVPLGRTGLLFSLYSVGLIPAVVFSGFLSELVGRRPVLLASVLVMAAGCALFGAVPSIGSSPNFAIALGVMVVLGVGAGGIETLTNAVVADDNQPSPGFALNFTHAFFAIGAVLAPVAVGLLLNAQLPWQIAFYGAAGMLILVFLILLPQSMPSAHGAGVSKGAASALLRSPVLWLMMLVLGMYVGAEIGLTAWISPLMEKTLGSARGLAASAVSVFWIFMIIGRFAAGALSVRVRPAPLIIAMGATSAVASLAAALAPTISTCLIGAAASGLFMAGIFAVVMTDAAHRFPRHTATAFGILIAGVGLGALVPPALMGYIAGFAGLRMAMLVPVALMALVAIVYAAMKPPESATQAGREAREGKHKPGP
jgi:fucose permease